jgi:hypothetical protein
MSTNTSFANDQRNIHNRDYAEMVESKWSQYLQHIPAPKVEGDMRRAATAMVLESTLNEMTGRDKAPRTLVSESAGTATANIADYQSTIFPVLMRVFPNLIAHDLVEIQPLSGPVGAIFYLDYKHNKRKGTVPQGSILTETFNETYSSEEIDEELLATGDGVRFGGAGAALAVTFDYSPVFPNNTTVSDPTYKVTISEVDGAGNVVQSAVDNGAGSFTGDVVGTAAFDYITGQLTNFRFTNPPATGNRVVVNYFYDQEGNLNLPEIALQITVDEIRAKTRKINITWTAEAADDLRALHGVEGETQLLSGVSNEIGLEIDREILRDIRNRAQTVDTWDRGGAPAGMAQMDYYRELVTKIQDVSSKILRKSKRALANWLVVSPEISSILVQFQGHADFSMLGAQVERPITYGQQTSDMGIYRMGLLYNRFQVFVDPYMRTDEIIVGYKGRNYLDAGYVYAPYIPLQMTQTFLDPEDHTNKKGLRTRYAKRMLRPEYYGRIKVLNV